MAGILKLNSMQLGDNVDPLKNFTLSIPTVPDGTLEIRRGNVEVAGEVVFKINADSTINLYKSEANDNKVINGNIVVDQRSGGNLVAPATDVYTVDRWLFTHPSIASKFSFQRNLNSITPPSGFSNYLGVTCTASYTPSTSESFTLQHRIEGTAWADMDYGRLTAKPSTLSFWVRSSVTGMFSGELYSSANRCYTFSYNINSANTWELKTVTIPGDVVSTTVTSTTGFAVILVWSLATGATLTTSTANTWQAGNYAKLTGSVGINTVGSTFYITGVQLTQGTTYTPYKPRPYGDELALCQRYYYTSICGFIGSSAGAGQTVGQYHSFPVNMRIPPTIVLSNPTENSNCGSINVGPTNSKAFRMYTGSISSGATYYTTEYTASSEL